MPQGTDIRMEWRERNDGPSLLIVLSAFFPSSHNGKGKSYATLTSSFSSIRYSSMDSGPALFLSILPTHPHPPQRSAPQQYRKFTPPPDTGNILTCSVDSNLPKLNLYWTLPYPTLPQPQFTLLPHNLGQLSWPTDRQTDRQRSQLLTEKELLSPRGRTVQG